MNYTLPILFEQSVEKYPNNILMWEKVGDKYIGISYKQMQKLVHNFAAGLIKLNLKKGERVALISEGRNDWVMSEMGVVFIGAINVPISVKIDELIDLKFRLSHSGCKFVIVSKRHLAKIRKIENDLPELEKIIVLDEIEDSKDNEISRKQVLKLGEEYLIENYESFNNLWKSIENDDFANICYTSGTTADPKGIILTHRNYTANVEQATSLLPIPEYYSSLLILPWDHSFAHTAGIYTLMKNGAIMSSIQNGETPIETLKNIPINIKETKPTFLLSVPTLAKNFRKNIENGINSKGEKVSKLFQKALKIAYEYNGNGFDRGKGLQKLKYPLLKVFDKILFSKIREGFGGKLEFFIGGGALLDIELQRFFYAIGIPMFQGYGLSEAAPIISANVPAIHKLGSSGRIVKNLDVKIINSDGNEVPIGESGEIICKGENVMAGYWNNEKSTKETLKDGWLYTGDLGYLDNDGFLYVLGRFKSLLIGNDGEKYSPEGIEEAFVDQSRFIEQVMLYNNQSPFTVCLLYPNIPEVLKELKKLNLSISSEDGKEAVFNIIQSEINRYKKGGEFEGMFPEKWLPTSIGILGEGFNEENKFLNSTLKMVRNKITEFYSNRIEYLYSTAGKNINNEQNRRILSHWGK
ncbi:MAG: AMP-binding protein [Bacteroidetes bacterium]|nr:AMP-binding protein [Bacteroidota bacterium]MBU1115521.1 AMP-binding protein [Bacteroidota bacterium]MBU1799573.1 AMP-binding protein [Bacteroidota bacterium]